MGRFNSVSGNKCSMLFENENVIKNSIKNSYWLDLYNETPDSRGLIL